MSGWKWTSDDLIRRVRRKLRIPDGDAAMSDAEILEIGDEVTRLHIQALLRGTEEEWHLTTADIALEQGRRTYPIPTRAQAATVREVTLFDGATEYDLPELGLERMVTGRRPWGRQTAQLLEDGVIALSPTPGAGDTGLFLRVRYRRRPSRLIPVSEAATVTSIGSTDYTTSGIPSAWGLSETLDAISAKPHHVLHGSDLACTISGVRIEPPAMIESVEAGDYFALSGETPVPQVPTVCHDLLVYGIAMVAAGELGRERREAALRASFGEAYRAAQTQLADRNEGSERKLFNRHSPLRQRGRWPW